MEDPDLYVFKKHSHVKWLISFNFCLSLNLSFDFNDAMQNLLIKLFLCSACVSKGALISNKHNIIVQKEKISKGENAILKILNSLINNKIILYYERQHTLPLKYIRNLRSDFYILDNQLVQYIIEYNGKQHYQYVKHYHKNHLITD